MLRGEKYQFFEISAKSYFNIKTEIPKHSLIAYFY